MQSYTSNEQKMKRRIELMRTYDCRTLAQMCTDARYDCPCRGIAMMRCPHEKPCTDITADDWHTVLYETTWTGQPLSL